MAAVAEDAIKCLKQKNDLAQWAVHKNKQDKIKMELRILYACMETYCSNAENIIEAKRKFCSDCTEENIGNKIVWVLAKSTGHNNRMMEAIELTELKATILHDIYDRAFGKQLVCRLINTVSLLRELFDEIQYARVAKLIPVALYVATRVGTADFKMSLDMFDKIFKCPNVKNISGVIRDAFAPNYTSMVLRLEPEEQKQERDAATRREKKRMTRRRERKAMSTVKKSKHDELERIRRTMKENQERIKRIREEANKRQRARMLLRREQERNSSVSSSAVRQKRPETQWIHQQPMESSSSESEEEKEIMILFKGKLDMFTPDVKNAYLKFKELVIKQHDYSKRQEYLDGEEWVAYLPPS